MAKDRKNPPNRVRAMRVSGTVDHLSGSGPAAGASRGSRAEPPTGRGSRLPDPIAGALIFVAGAAGVTQLATSWTSSTVAGQTTSLTGWTLFQLGRAGASTSTRYAINGYSILAVGIAGAVLALLGVLTVVPIRHRPVAVLALVIGLISLAAELWWVLNSEQALSESFTTVFRYAGPGWYFFLAAGPLALIGAGRALATSGSSPLSAAAPVR